MTYGSFALHIHGIRATSALPPKADIRLYCIKCSDGPNADIESPARASLTHTTAGIPSLHPQRKEPLSPIFQFTSASSFVRSPTWIFSSDRTAFLISRPNCAPTWPAASLSNLALISSQLNGRVGNPG